MWIIIFAVIVIYFMAKTSEKKEEEIKKLSNKHWCGQIVSGYKKGYILYNFDRRTKTMYFIPPHTDLEKYEASVNYKDTFGIFDFRKVKWTTARQINTNYVEVITKYYKRVMTIQLSLSGYQKFQECLDAARTTYIG